MEPMKEIILQKLRDIEQAENVTILFAVESGSRAWGFASPDSDYDVRFIYLRRQEDYLRVTPPKDVIQWQLDEVLDINGWDMKKALRLLEKSNPSLFEWLGSPIVYDKSPFWEELSRLFYGYYAPKRGMYHYLSMAKGDYLKHFSGEQVNLKKYFYALRPLLACQWIGKYGTPPPMAFGALVEELLPERLRPMVRDLVARKIVSSEVENIEKIKELDVYIEEMIASLDAQVRTMAEPMPWDRRVLDQVFYDLVCAG